MGHSPASDHGSYGLIETIPELTLRVRFSSPAPVQDCLTGQGKAANRGVPLTSFQPVDLSDRALCVLLARLGLIRPRGLELSVKGTRDRLIRPCRRRFVDHVYAIVTDTLNLGDAMSAAGRHS